MELKKDMKDKILLVMVEDTILIVENYAHVLFNYGFTHYYITPLYAEIKFKTSVNR